MRNRLTDRKEKSHFMMLFFEFSSSFIRFMSIVYKPWVMLSSSKHHEMFIMYIIYNENMIKIQLIVVQYFQPNSIWLCRRRQNYLCNEIQETTKKFTWQRYMTVDDYSLQIYWTKSTKILENFSSKNVFRFFLDLWFFDFDTKISQYRLNKYI